MLQLAAINLLFSTIIISYNYMSQLVAINLLFCTYYNKL